MTGSFQSCPQGSVYLKNLVLLMIVAMVAAACSTLRPGPVTPTSDEGERPPDIQSPTEIEPQPEISVPDYLTHTIQYRGETLYAIARWYTGDAENWRALVRANPTLDPKGLNIGDAIRIPEDIVINRDPMPAVKTALRLKDKTPPSRQKSDRTLFGPMETSSPSSGNQVFGPVDAPPSTARQEGLARPLETLD